MDSGQLITATTWGGYIGMAIAAAYGIWQGWKNKNGADGEKAAAAKDDLIKSITADRDSWKSISEAQRIELAQYRDACHLQANDANKKILALTEESAKLRASTDITPLLKHTDEQSQINVKILSTLDMIVSHLKRLTSKQRKKLTRVTKKATTAK